MPFQPVFKPGKNDRSILSDNPYQIYLKAVVPAPVDVDGGQVERDARRLVHQSVPQVVRHLQVVLAALGVY